MKIAMHYLFRIKTLLAQQLFDNVSTTYGRLAIRKFYLRKLRLTNTYKIFFLIGPFSGIIYTYGYEISVCQLSIYLIMHVTNETVRLRERIHPSPPYYFDSSTLDNYVTIKSSENRMVLKFLKLGVFQTFVRQISVSQYDDAKVYLALHHFQFFFSRGN